MTSDSSSLRNAEIRRRLRDTDKIVEIVQQAGLQAEREIVQRGGSIPVWRNNQVVWLTPEQWLQEHGESPRLEDGRP